MWHTAIVDVSSHSEERAAGALEMLRVPREGDVVAPLAEKAARNTAIKRRSLERTERPGALVAALAVTRRIRRRAEALRAALQLARCAATPPPASRPPLPVTAASRESVRIANAGSGSEWQGPR